MKSFVAHNFLDYFPRSVLINGKQIIERRYIDDDEVVLSLKKMDSKVTWPALEQAWASLTTGVSQLLKGTSIYVVGASSEINWAVARELATGLEYVVLIAFCLKKCREIRNILLCVTT